MNKREPSSLASQKRLRDDGEAAIIAALREVGPMSRLELSRRADLGRTTVFEIVRDLVARQILVESAVELPRGRGRPTTAFALNPQTALFAGIEVARQHVRALLVNAAHEEIAYGAAPLSAPGTSEMKMVVLRLLRRIAGEGNATLDHIKLVGLGYSGVVDPFVPSAAIRQLQVGLERSLHATVKVANNSHLASLAEATWGAARDHESVLYVHWSSGIGSGWVSKRRLLHGAHGMAGELGHMSLSPGKGPECYCGGHGCLEMLAGLEALTRRFDSLGRDKASEGNLIDAVKNKDPAALKLVGEAATQVGRAISAATVLLDPSVIVLGGEMSALGQLIAEPIQACLTKAVTPRFARTLEVRHSVFGELGAVRGAVALVLPEIQFPSP